jgi:hypothetical protein
MKTRANHSVVGAKDFDCVFRGTLQFGGAL